jgi:hypothetical protein
MEGFLMSNAEEFSGFDFARLADVRALKPERPHGHSVHKRRQEQSDKQPQTPCWPATTVLQVPAYPKRSRVSALPPPVERNAARALQLHRLQPVDGAGGGDLHPRSMCPHLWPHL